MDTIMDANRELLILMARTGVFFAQVDGNIDLKAQSVLTDYLTDMVEEMELDEKVPQLLDRTSGRRWSLEEIVPDTRRYLESFNEFERKSILNSMARFIELVIQADGLESLEEKQAYLDWQQRVGYLAMDISRFQENYSEEGFWKKLGKCARKAGLKVVYAALLLYYVSTDESVPMKIRVSIFGVLGYLILPFDLIPDFVPGMGFTDDLGALLAICTLVSDHITPEVEKKAKARLSDWFGVFDEKDLAL